MVIGFPRMSVLTSTFGRSYFNHFSKSTVSTWDCFQQRVRQTSFFWCTKPRGLGFPYSENAMARVVERMVCVGVTWNQHPSGCARACLARSQFLRRSLDHLFSNWRLFQFREVQALIGFLTRRCRDFLVQYLILVLQRDSHVFHFSCRFIGVWADTNEQDKTKRSNTELSAQSSAIFCR